MYAILILILFIKERIGKSFERNIKKSVYYMNQTQQLRGTALLKQHNIFRNADQNMLI